MNNDADDTVVTYAYVLANSKYIPRLWMVNSHVFHTLHPQFVTPA